MQQIVDILEKSGDEIVYALRKSLKDNNRIATGNTAKNITSRTTTNGRYFDLIVEAPSHLRTLQDGRKPSKTSGGAGFKENIEEWIKARNIHAQGIKPEQLLFLIYRKINKKGFDGTAGLIDSVINRQLFDRIELDVSNVVTNITADGMKITIDK